MSEAQKTLIEMNAGDLRSVNGTFIMKSKDYPGMFYVHGYAVDLATATHWIEKRKHEEPRVID